MHPSPALRSFKQSQAAMILQRNGENPHKSLSLSRFSPLTGKTSAKKVRMTTNKPTEKNTPLQPYPVKWYAKRILDSYVHVIKPVVRRPLVVDSCRLQDNTQHHGILLTLSNTYFVSLSLVFVVSFRAVPLARNGQLIVSAKVLGVKFVFHCGGRACSEVQVYGRYGSCAGLFFYKLPGVESVDTVHAESPVTVRWIR